MKTERKERGTDGTPIPRYLEAESMVQAGPSPGLGPRAKTWKQDCITGHSGVNDGEWTGPRYLTNWGGALGSEAPLLVLSCTWLLSPVTSPPQHETTPSSDLLVLPR